MQWHQCDDSIVLKIMGREAQGIPTELRQTDGRCKRRKGAVRHSCCARAAQDTC